MPTPLPLLDRVRIASPCPMRWEDLSPIAEGVAGGAVERVAGGVAWGAAGGRVRHCGRCGLNVYNLSNMTRGEAESLLAAHAGSGDRLCAGFYRKADGTVLTRDCPVGRLAVRRRARLALTRIAALVTLLAGGGAIAARKDGPAAHRLADLGPFCRIALFLDRSGAVPEATPDQIAPAPVWAPGRLIFPQDSVRGTP
jgi:hypothetical protein